MATIHRLLCTHCTFGSSELEPNTAENAAKVLGYSVRRSSLPESDRGPLRNVFRAVERLLSYDLPKDTPAAKKEALEADTAPRRLVFLPNLGGWQAAAHIAYRTRDTHGRIGSYFADVLATRLDRDTRPWSPLDVLQLWAASHDGTLRAAWWCDSEERLTERDGDARWKPVDATLLAELRSSDDPFIDDELLQQFLKLEPGEPAKDPGLIVPTRWWSMPARQRRDLLAALLNAVIQSHKNGGKESVVIAIEPSVAALLFYGVFRLLPSRLREGIGFSTYEAAPARPLTPLVATTFIDGEALTADLTPEVAARGFACNTFRDVGRFGRTTPSATDGFVRRVIDLAATSGGWAQLDGFLAALDALPRPDFRNLDELAKIDAFVTHYVTGSQKLDSLGPEPPASPGSDGEKYRRVRFRTLVGQIAGSHVGKWPRDIVRKAVDWLGDDFSSDWDGGGPLAEALRSRMPDDDNGLAKVLEALKSTRTTPRTFMSEAVVRVALAEGSPGLPPSFVAFVAKGSRQRGDELLPLVQAVLERLADRNRQDLLEAPDVAFVAPILDAVQAWEKERPGRWNELRVPLLPILSRELTTTRDTTKSRAEFLVRHCGLADILRQCARPQPFNDAIANFFLSILRLSSTAAKVLKPGEFLSAEGRSRTTDLERWLPFVGQDRDNRCREQLDAWKTVHGVIGKLKSVAENAGTFSSTKPSAGDVEGFTRAYDVLTPEKSIDGVPAAQRLELVLATSMEGMGVATAARPMIYRWLNRALLEDATARGAAIAGRRPSGAPTGAKTNLITGIVSSIAVAGLVLGVVLLQSRLQRETALPPAAVPEAETGVNSALQAADTTETMPQENAASASGRGGPALQRDGAPAQTSGAIRQPPPLTPDSLGFDATFAPAAIKATWKKGALEGATLTLRIKGPAGTEPSTESNLTVAAEAHTWKVPTFGEYSVQLLAERQGSPKVESREIKLAFPKPPKPDVMNPGTEPPQIVVGDDGQPHLQLRVKSPVQSDLARYGLIKVVLRVPGASSPQESTFSESLAFKLPADSLMPSQAMDDKSRFKLHINTSLGDGAPCEFSIPKPPGFTADLCERLKRREFLGVPHVCPLEEKCVAGKQTFLLDFPWWFIDGGLKSFDLRLLTPAKATESGEPLRISATSPAENTPKRWECKSGDTPVGFFEVYCPDAWRSELRYVANDQQTEDSEKAYERLRTCRLCFLNDDKPCATAQLMKPIPMGQLVLHLPEDVHADKLPPIFAKAELPVAWDKMQLREVLSGGVSPETRPKGLAIALKQPDPGKAFVAKLVASHAENEISANVNLMPNPVNNKEMQLQINGWTWSKVPLSDKSKKKPIAPAAALKEPVSPKLVAEMRDRHKQLLNLQADVERRKQEHMAEKDEKKKSSKQKELDDAQKDLADLEKKRAANNDELLLPCLALFDALVGKDTEIGNWELKWSVQATTGAGIDEPENIPGGVAVVGAIGTKDGMPAVRLEAKVKK